MMNLQLIENQPRWRIWIVARFAQLMGVCIHVEGIPFGSGRTRKERSESETAMGAAVGRKRSIEDHIQADQLAAGPREHTQKSTDSTQ